MEKWEEVFKGKIPKGNYQTSLLYGEEKGLIIELFNAEKKICIDFGIVYAVRILDEGIVQSTLYSKTEIEKYKISNFSNVIYEIHNGEFNDWIYKITDSYGRQVCKHHYIVVTMNYNIDIITEYPPIFKVYSNK